MRVLFIPVVALCLTVLFSPELSGQSSEGTQARPASRPEGDTEKTRSDTPDLPSSDVPPDSTKLEAIKRAEADYPIEASMKGIQGQVMLLVMVSETGDVERAEVVSGDQIFKDSAIAAVKKWKFKPYIKGGKAIKVSTKIPFDFAFGDKTKDYSSPPSQSVAQPTTPTNPPELPKRVRVSQGVSQGLLLHKVQPVYPAMARMNGIQGTVFLKAHIDKEGRISELTPMSGPPELVDAAVGAVKQWRYRPYLLQGQPVEVETQITVNFTLGYR